MSDPTTPPFVCPADLAGASTTELLSAWHGHVSALVNDRHGLADLPLSAGRLRSHALDALAVGQALVDAITDTRWTTCVEALTYGAGVERTAAAMGLDVDEVIFGLRSWADGQMREHLMTPVEHDVVLALVEEVGSGR